MEKYLPYKIHIIGSVGSGKTTLARRLSAKMDLVHYELDNVVWKRCETGDVRRSERERHHHLQKILQSDAWIIEGVHYEWVKQSFKEADVIILLNPHYAIRTFRIIRRFILQKLGLEKSNYKPTFAMLWKMFAWNRHFETVSKSEIVSILSEYNGKLMILKNSKQLEKIFKLEA